MEKTKAIKCIECGATMRTSRESYRYMALPKVVLDNVEVRRCADCGEDEVVIPRIEELNRLIATLLIQAPEPLKPAEIRFLRKFMGWSGVDFANHFGVTPENVSRWENGKKRMSQPAQRLLRLCVANQAPVEDYGVEQLPQVSKEGKRPTEYQARLQKQQWIGGPAAVAA